MLPVASEAVCSGRIALSTVVSTSAGAPPVAIAMPRRIERTWPISAAASTSCPTTSPITSMVAPSGWRNASYQAPPTRAASIRDPGSCAMKLCSRNTARGNENIVCDSQIWASVPFTPGEGSTVTPAMRSPCT